MWQVLTTLFISVSTALPKTAYIKVGKKNMDHNILKRSSKLRRKDNQTFINVARVIFT